MKTYTRLLTLFVSAVCSFVLVQVAMSLWRVAPSVNRRVANSGKEYDETTLSNALSMPRQQHTGVRSSKRRQLELCIEAMSESASPDDRGDQGVHVVKATKGMDMKADCETLQTPRGPTPICLHSDWTDGFVSAAIRRGEVWEADLRADVEQTFLAFPQLDLLDIGSHVGSYSIPVAKMGRSVVAIDALLINLKRLLKSLVLGKIQQRTALVWNAVSDRRENVSLELTLGNLGRTIVHEHEYRKNSHTKRLLVETITLDSLRTCFTNTSLFVKMDIEGYEHKALLGAQRFFQEVDVHYILMEFVFHKDRQSGADIIKLMQTFGFTPCREIRCKTRLDPTLYSRWPDDVFWVRDDIYRHHHPHHPPASLPLALNDSDIGDGS